nr:glucuronate isomerase [Metabacillus kandeliae]
MKEDMLLSSKMGEKLYHGYAKDMPIFDYHTHLDARDICEDKIFSNPAEVWLAGDHYKWRAMRWLGIEEKLITGDADDKQKFLAWASCVPKTAGNPLFLWTHLELYRYFGIKEMLSADNAERVWDECSEKLRSREYSARSLMRAFSVEVLCTTDDPADSLEHHAAMLENSSKTDCAVLPAFRPDSILNCSGNHFTNCVLQLQEASSQHIASYSGLLTALEARINFFHAHGCRISDHGFSEFPLVKQEKVDQEAIFQKAMNGGAVTNEEAESFQGELLLFLARKYHSLGWAMQLHIGAARNNKTAGFLSIGKDAGFDSMLDFMLSRRINAFLDALDREGKLPKTVLYSLNPVHHEVLASAIGNFQGGGIKGKLQLGAGWWFNDQKDGIERQLTCLASIGLISTFIGMVTDSRSFLSFPRHEYFRRILCSLIGSWAENGELPMDEAFLGEIIQDICLYNAREYFSLKIE